jgi:hypothetical protein
MTSWVSTERGSVTPSNMANQVAIDRFDRVLPVHVAAGHRPALRPKGLDTPLVSENSSR